MPGYFVHNGQLFREGKAVFLLITVPSGTATDYLKPYASLMVIFC